MPLNRLKEYLDQNHARYKIITHSPAYSAQETARAAHVHGMDLMKAVIARIDGDCVMLVIPAPYRVNIEELKTTFATERVALASETDFRELFPNCELGAIPPFGQMFQMDTYVAPCFGERQMVVFNAGTHADLINIEFKDFVRLAGAKPLTGGYNGPAIILPRMKEHTGKHFQWH